MWYVVPCKDKFVSSATMISCCLCKKQLVNGQHKVWIGSLLQWLKLMFLRDRFTVCGQQQKHIQLLPLC